MSLLDSVLIFGKDVVASNATQFNVFDLGHDGRDLSGNRHGAGYLNVHVNSNMSDTATTISLYEGDTAAAVNTATGTAITLTNKKAGEQFTVKLPRKLKRFVTVKCSAANTGKIDAFIGAPLADH
jgi:hypothetical protein